MQFTEQKAAELIEQHSLAKYTLAVWRHRGYIPDKYEGEAPATLSINELQQQQAKNITQAIKTEKFNISSLCRLSEINEKRLHDVLRGNLKFYESDFVALKKAINILRNEVKKVLSDIEKSKSIQETTIKSVRKLFERQELQWFVIFDRNRKLYQKFESWTRDKRSFPEEEINNLKSAMLVFLTETSV